ncbi:MAG: exo-alpha-sialidase [Actinomycetota bacterium]
MTLRRMILACLLAAISPAMAQHAHHGPAPRAECTADTRLPCAAAATPAFLADGGLVVAWSAGGRVMAARADGAGSPLAAPVALNAAPEPIDDNGEARPMVAASGRRVWVAWSVRTDKAFNGRLMLAVSEDGGRSFGPARAVADDPASQRFAALGVGRGGRLYMAWIDKRGLAAAKRRGEDYRGAALAVGWSDDGGGLHQEVAADHSCECCRVAMAFDGRGLPVLLWRHVFAPNIRDHAVMAFAQPDRPGPVVRVAEDDWRIDACPHHGPALAVTADGGVVAAWYTAGNRRQGLFLARAAAPGAAFGEPRAIGDAERLPSHPQLLAQGGRLWLAWTEFDGERTWVMAQVSEDGGASWGSPWTLATTHDASDHPQLVSDGRRGWLSWLTRAEGWRLMPLEGAP